MVLCFFFGCMNLFTQARLVSIIDLDGYEIDIFPCYMAIFYANLEVDHDEDGLASSTNVRNIDITFSERELGEILGISSECMSLYEVAFDSQMTLRQSLENPHGA